MYLHDYKRNSFWMHITYTILECSLSMIIHAYMYQSCQVINYFEEIREKLQKLDKANN